MWLILYYNNFYKKNKHLVAIIVLVCLGYFGIAFFFGTGNTLEVTVMSTGNTQSRTRFIFLLKFNYIIMINSTYSNIFLQS